MAHLYSENASYWANSETKRSSHRGATKALDIREQEECEPGLGRIEPVRLTFDSPAASKKSLADHWSAPLEDNGSQKVDGEAVPAEEVPADTTPTASLLDGVQTPEHPEELTGQPGMQPQACHPASLPAEVAQQLVMTGPPPLQMVCHVTYLIEGWPAGPC